MDLEHALHRLPDGMGVVHSPAIHPSSSLGAPFCPRFFLYQRRLGWYKPRWVEAYHSGHVFHEIMQHVRSGLSLESAIALVHHAAADNIQQQAQEWAETKPDATPPDWDKMLKAVAVGAVLAQVFCEKFPMDNERWEVIAVERRYRLMLDPIIGKPSGAVLEGTVDSVVVDKRKEQRWLEDHKSTSAPAHVRARGLTFDTQSRLYRALHDLSDDGAQQKARGIIHNIIEKPTIRQRTKRSPETFEEYLDRCAQQYDDRALTNPQQPPLLRSFAVFSQPPIQQDVELLGMLRSSAERHVRPLGNLSSWPRIGRAYNGCLTAHRTPCPYMSLCEIENPGAWAMVLEREHILKRDPAVKEPSDVGQPD